MRTLVYHQVATETSGVDNSKGIAFSKNGARAVFVVSEGKYKVTVIDVDGSTRRVIEEVSANWIDRLAISDDGTWVTYSGTGTQLRIAKTDGSSAPSTLVELPVAVHSPRFARDPAQPQAWRVYFVLPSDISSPQLSRGVYSVKTDGSGLQLLLAASEVAGLLGAAANQVSPIGDRAFDVSTDGKRFVVGFATGFCTQSGAKDYLVAATHDGVTRKMLLGPLTNGCGLQRAALSGAGATVAYTFFVNSDDRELGVTGFDGSGQRKLATLTGDDGAAWGLSDDGARLLVNHSLHATDGSGAFALAVIGGFWSSDPPSIVGGYLGRLAGNGRRALYVDANASPRVLATLELDPPSLGAAAQVSNPVVTPAVLTRNPNDYVYATVSAAVAQGTATLARVSSAVLKDGMSDTNQGVSGENVMLDDGTKGDVAAGDGVFTQNAIRVSQQAPPGPRTVRVRAEVATADGRRHATVVDFGPFAVQ